MEWGPIVSDFGCRISRLFCRLNILDKHRSAHLHLASIAITVSLGALGARPVSPIGVMYVWVPLVATTTTFSSTGANPVVVRWVHPLAVSVYGL